MLNFLVEIAAFCKQYESTIFDIEKLVLWKLHSMNSSASLHLQLDISEGSSLTLKPLAICHPIDLRVG